MGIDKPYKPVHSVKWLEDYFKDNYYKRPYNRFHWWRSYVDKNKPMSNRSPLRDRILNGDFGLASYKFEAEVVEHRMNERFAELYTDMGRYVEETSLDRARRKRLLEDYETDEKRKLNDLAKSFSDLIGLTKEKIFDELVEYNDTLIEFYYFITEKYPRKNGIAYL